MDRSTVFRHLDRLEVQRRGGRRLTTEDVRAAAEKYSTGCTLKAIGQELGVHGDTVRRALVDAGVVIRPAARPVKPRRLSAEQIEDCRRRRESGETLQALVDEVGVSRETLRRALLRAGP